MFGSSKNSDDKKNAGLTGASTSSSLNALAKGAILEGNLRCDSDIRVDGSIKGNVNCAAKIIIGPSGAIEGEVRCQNAVIEGLFKGKLEVKELLNVRESASVDGEIRTGKLLVQSGAKFNVNCNMQTGATDNGAVNKNTTANAAANAAAVPGGKA